MKKFRMLMATILSATFVAGPTVTGPVASAAVEEIYVTEDFNSYADIPAMLDGGNIAFLGDEVKGSTMTDGGKDGKGLHVAMNDDKTNMDFVAPQVVLGEKISQGEIKLKFDIKLDNISNDMAHIYYRANQDKSITLFSFNNGVLNAGGAGFKSGSTIGSYQANLWYHCEANYNIDTAKLSYSVSCEDEGMAPMEGTVDARVVSGAKVTDLNFQTWIAGDENGFTLDNIDISWRVETIDNLSIDETFDYDSIEQMKSEGNWEFMDRPDGPIHACAIVDEGKDGKGLKIAMDNDSSGGDNVRPTLSFDKVYTGKIKAEFDIKPTAGRIAHIYFARGNSNCSLLFFDGSGKIGLAASNVNNLLGEYTSGEWYHCIIVHDIDTATFSVKVEGDDGSTLIRNDVSTRQLNYLDGMTFQNWAYTTDNSGFILDNVNIEWPTDYVIEAPKEDPLSMTENFEEYSDIQAVADSEKWNLATFGKAHKYELVEGKDGGKALYVALSEDDKAIQGNPDSVQAQFKFDKAATSGKIKATFDLKANVINNNMAHVYFGQGVSVMSALGWRNGNAAAGTNGDGTASTTTNRIGSYLANVWYDCTVIYDIDEKTVTAQMVDPYGNRIAKTVNGRADAGSLDSLWFQTWIGDVNDGFTVDNIEITWPTEDVIEDAQETSARVLGLDDFNSYTTLDDAASWTVSDGFASEQTDKVNRYPSIITDGKDDTKGLQLGKSTNVDNVNAKYSFGRVTSGRVKASFDLKPGGDGLTTYTWFGSGGANSSALYFNSNGFVYAGANTADDSKKIGPYSVKQWYHCEVIADLDLDLISATITNADGVSMTIEDVATRGNSHYDYYDNFNFQIWGGSTNVGSVFDNFKIETLPPKAPELDNTDIAFIEGEESSSDTAAVSTSIDAIELNFHTDMNIDSLSGMKLHNTVTGEDEAYTLEKGVLSVLIHPTNTLSADTAYQIIVPAEAANTSGDKLGKEVVLSFTTESNAKFEGSIDSVKVNGTDVTSIGQLQQGTQIDAAVKLINATEDEKNSVVIFGYYAENGSLVRLQSVTVPAGAGAKVNQTVSNTVGDMTDVKEVKVMLWDGFENIVPMDSSVDIK